MSRTKTMWPVLAVLLLAACGNNEGGNETASSDVNAPDDVTSSGASSVTFQGVTSPANEREALLMPVEFNIRC